MNHPETPAYLPWLMLAFAGGAIVLLAFLIWLIRHQGRMETNEATSRFAHQHLADVYSGKVSPSPDDPVIESYDDLGFGPAVSEQR